MATPRSQVRAGLYVRISQVEQYEKVDGRSLGTQRQEADCRKEAQRRRWEIADVYVDDDRSAFSGKLRPEYRRLCDDIKNGVVDAVVVWDVDRLHRSPRELEDFVSLIESTGAIVASVSGGDYDLETADGRFKARIMGAVARKESEDKSRRIRRKHEEIVADGRPNGAAPYGYRRVGSRSDPAAGGADTRRLVAEPSEREVVREVVERIARGEALSRIAADLDARGVPAPDSARWVASTVRRFALNPAYIGRRSHHGRDVGAAKWEPIVDEATWRRANALLTDPARRQRRAARRYLLSGGLVVCGACGGPLRSKQTGTTAVYACRPRERGVCGKVSISADYVEHLVREAVCKIVEGRDYAAALRRVKGVDRDAAARVAEIERELDELIEAKAAGAFPRLAEYLRLREGIEERLDAARRSLGGDVSSAATIRYAGKPGALGDDWDSLSLDRRQAIVRAVVKPVVIRPAGDGPRRFDPERVVVERLV
jgi:site-specific DNA recombinase